MRLVWEPPPSFIYLRVALILVMFYLLLDYDIVFSVTIFARERAVSETNTWPLQ